jgi:hypothetical protein
MSSKRGRGRPKSRVGSNKCIFGDDCTIEIRKETYNKYEA